MATHELKTDPCVFQDLIAGEKTYEIRRDDRGFGVGDTLILRETEHSGEQMAAGAPMEYTGRTAIRRVTHALRGPRYGLAEGWAILSVNDPEKDALAAHVERMRKAALDAIHHLPGGKIKAALRDAYDDTHTTSLARRQAEGGADGEA